MVVCIKYRIVVWLAAALTLTLAKSSFRLRLPNGMLVPHPCGPAYVWRGVGHDSHLGGGPRNQFGLDFKDAGLEWTKELCEKDSDGDGLSNGEELGDPDCTWSPGTQPTRISGLSHPGVCEPLNADKCEGKNDFVSCDDLCDGVKEDGVFRQTATLDPPVTVASRKMTHKCMVFELPQDGDYHMIAVQPQISDFRSLIQLTILGCDGDSFPETPGNVYDCYMNTACPTYLFQWSAGDSDICFHTDAGFRIPRDFKRAVLEVHLYNPEDTARQDGSGVNLFFTPNRRLYDAGIFFFGQWNVQVPPQETDHVISGGCSADCTREIILSNTISVTAAFNHMHYTGIKAIAQRIAGGRVDYIAYDETFSYDKTKYHRFATPMKINAGDGLNMECHYDTMTRNVTSFYGLDTFKDEMCYGYLMYYPKEILDLPFCQSYGDLDNCDFLSERVDGCDTDKLKYTDPDNVPEFTAVQVSCRAGTCLKECMTLLKTVKRHPCYSGSLRQYYMMAVEEDNRMGTATEQINFLTFWLKMASCDKEFAAIGNDDDDTSPAARPRGGLTIIMTLTLLLSSLTIIV